MNDYVIIRHKELYKIYKQVDNNRDLYQYVGASFVMLSDAQDFIDMKRDDLDAS